MMQYDSNTVTVLRTGRMIRVLVADDHPLTRLGIRHALGEGFDVCAEAGDAESAVAAARREDPDICLLDVRMPGNGITAAARIAAEVPAASVVMISAAADDDTLFAALRAGAVGYLPKEMAFTRLPEALRGVLDGEAAVPREAMARLLREFRRSGRSRPPRQAMRASATLTGRETDVLELLLEGFGTAEIGHKLFQAPPTVRSHVAALLRKFGVRDRDALRGLFDGSGRIPERDSSAALVRQRPA
jgi:DNA-binding NarL/FixJ family response regulator